MAKTKITDVQSEQLEITSDSDGDIWTLTKASAVLSTPTAIVSTATKFKLNVAGDVTSANSSGISMGGDQWTLNLAATSTVTAIIGLNLGGETFVANLDGNIESLAYGVRSAAYTAEVNIGVGAHISGWGYYGIYHGSVTRSNFQIDGSVMGGPVGMYLFGTGEDTINIGKTGLIAGEMALQLDGTSAEAKYAVHNSGEITGTNAISAIALAGVEIVNDKHGEIVATSIAISAQGTFVTIVNHGTIATSDGGIAIEFSSLTGSSIVNDGWITGTVRLGESADVFDTRGGVVDGAIEGNNGHDTLVVDDATVTMVENVGEGIDTVRSTVSYTLGDNIEQLTLLGKSAIDATGNALDNTLRGNGATNTLSGLGGDDKLYGGKGSDRLFGGDDNDTFYFLTGNGKDKVMDFEQGEDVINLKGWSVFDSFKDLMTHAADKGDDLLITYGKDSLLIAGVHKADVTSSDILV